MNKKTKISRKTSHKKHLKELRMKKLEQKMKLNILKRKKVNKKNG